ncbi:MAG: hypothetical protein JSR72_19575 [Proteobacteria bacterium]|nr:hypothetical protein [Pseudomonadota bacterium]
MPLFTYVACYRGGTYSDQDAKGNFKGSAAVVIGRIPENALPSFSATLRKAAIEKTYRIEWQAIPNKTNLWRTSFELDGSEFAIYAVQTER